MNKGYSPFTQIKQVKILCIFIIEGHGALENLWEVGGGEVQKNIYSRRGKLNEKYSCTLNAKKYSRKGLKNSYKGNFMRLENSPPSPPQLF